MKELANPDIIAACRKNFNRGVKCFQIVIFTPTNKVRLWLRGWISYYYALMD